MSRGALQLLLFACAFLSLVAFIQICIVSYTARPIWLQVLHPEYSDEPDLDLRQHRLPKCIIIGTRKGGTRALVDALTLHPLIKAPRREIHFFDKDELYFKGIEWYKKQMPETFAHEIGIEKSPSYLPSRAAPKRVHDVDPSMKLIVILRDPVVRTISDFTQVYYNRVELKKWLPVFEEVVFRNNSDGINENYKPVSNSLYDVHFEHWLSYFPLSQIHVVDGDKFGVDPLPELRKVEEFLEVPHLISEQNLVWDEHKGFYCFRKAGRSAHCLGSTKGRTHRPVSTTTRFRLRSLLSPHNERLFALIGRRFNW